MRRTNLGTSLSVSTSIGDELKLKQQEVLDNFQVKTAEFNECILCRRFLDSSSNRSRDEPKPAQRKQSESQALPVLSFRKFNNGEGFQKNPKDDN